MPAPAPISTAKRLAALPAGAELAPRSASHAHHGHAGHDHAHHDHAHHVHVDAHAHQHGHAHRHAPAAPVAEAPGFSLLACSAGQRVLFVLPVILGLWLVTIWAIGHG